MAARPQLLNTWVIGSGAGADIVVDHPMVSGQHCRLCQYDQGFAVEELGSTNGTWVNGRQLPPHHLSVVTPQQAVTLGRTIPLPWPEGAADGQPGQTSATRVIRVGRSPDSDVVLDYPMISWDHARIVEQGDQYFIEDVNSRNGVAINEVRNRITRAPLRETDDVYLGSFKVPAARLLQRQRVALGDQPYQQVTFRGNSMVIGRDPQCDQPLNYPMISWHHARVTREPDGMYVEDLGSRNGTFVDGVRINGKVRVHPGQEFGLGSFRFQLLDTGELARRTYYGNISIEARELVVTAPDGNRLLDSMSLTVFPSELVALMGPAGAGKTTLLKALNGYTPPASGKVLYNGANLYELYDRFRQQLGYVPQDDIIHPQLTVREALYFSAKLRTDLSDAEIEERIGTVLDDLGILDKKDTIIGSPERKVLSGGQRKRVNIALELINDTPVLFLDEPTSGLSSYDAEGVVRLLKRLSREGKTIIATIHQPSLAIFQLFDDLIMIGRDQGGCGALAYFGPAYPDSIEFFDRRPPAAAESDPRELNPEILLSGLSKATTSEWASRFAASPYKKQFVDDRAGKVLSSEKKETAPVRRFDLRQWATLFRRNVILKARDRAQSFIMLLQAPIFAVLIALVYGVVAYKASPSATQFQRFAASLSGIHFLMVVAAIWFGCNNAVRDVVGEWTVFQRERMVSLKLPSYVFSKMGVLALLCLFQCTVLLGIVTLACKLDGNFFEVLMVLLLSSLAGAALGLCISSCASTTESAIAVLPLALLPMIVFGGGLFPVYRMPKVAQVISYVAPSRWAFEADLVKEESARDDAKEKDSLNGWDVASYAIPKHTVKENGEEQMAPENPLPTNATAFRLVHSYLDGFVALFSMLGLFLGSVLRFLKLRDIH
jgi:ABC transport system ATP-binding/permease protein